MRAAMSLSSSTTSTRLMRPPRGDYRRGTAEPLRGQSNRFSPQLERQSRLNSSIPAGTRVDEEKTTEGIMALHNIHRKGAAAAAVIGLGALLVGCSRETSLNGAQSAGAAPLSVACES